MVNKSPAQQAYEEAVTRADAGDGVQARALLKHALQLDPAFGRARALLSALQAVNGRSSDDDGWDGLSMRPKPRPGVGAAPVAEKPALPARLTETLEAPKRPTSPPPAPVPPGWLDVAPAAGDLLGWFEHAPEEVAPPPPQPAMFDDEVTLPRDLLAEASAAARDGDAYRAVQLAVEALNHGAPPDLVALQLEPHASAVMELCATRLGKLHHVPKARVGVGDLRGMVLCPRAALVFSLVDGKVTYRDILAAGNMRPWLVLLLCVSLMDAGAIR
jgi:hypothetical protein